MLSELNKRLLRQTWNSFNGIEQLDLARKSPKVLLDQIERASHRPEHALARSDVQNLLDNRAEAEQFLAGLMNS